MRIKTWFIRRKLKDEFFISKWEDTQMWNFFFLKIVQTMSGRHFQWTWNFHQFSILFRQNDKKNMKKMVSNVICTIFPIRIQIGPISQCYWCTPIYTIHENWLSQIVNNHSMSTKKPHNCLCVFFKKRPRISYIAIIGNEWLMIWLWKWFLMVSVSAIDSKMMRKLCDFGKSLFRSFFCHLSIVCLWAVHWWKCNRINGYGTAFGRKLQNSFVIMSNDF